LAVEREFAIEVGPHVVRGSIDRIDRMPDGSIEIIDYKTSREPATASEVADDVQLAVYHLAATRDPSLAALGPPARLRLVYLRRLGEPGKAEREQPITPDHAARTEARILRLADRMLAGEIDPSPAGDCDHCDFHRLCPLQPEGREVGLG